MRRSRFVIPGAVLLLAAAFLVDGLLTPDSVPRQETPPVEPGAFFPPQWVVADHKEGRIVLSWRSVPSAMVYSLRRSKDAGAGFEVIHTGRDTTYSDGDELVPGNRYCYVLTAIDPEFDESGLSGEKCVEFSGGGEDTGNPAPLTVK